MKLLKVVEIAMKKRLKRIIEKKLKNKLNKIIEYFFKCPYYQITKDTTKRFKQGKMFNDKLLMHTYHF